MARDNKAKGKTAGSQNEGRQQMDRAGRASEGDRGGGHESYGGGTSNSAPVAGEERDRIGGGNEGGGGAARPSDR
jgi:hypothetical protein